MFDKRARPTFPPSYPSELRRIMLDAFRLIPALKIIFKSEIEFTEGCFVKLNSAQRKAFKHKMGESKELIYRVVPFEPSVIERAEDKITVELSIVTGSERRLLLDAVDFVYRASAEMPGKSPTFKQRLSFLRTRLPPIVVGGS